jgi:nucleoside-diphosphate-sugar epimerase
VKELTNSNSEIVFEELPKDDPARRKPDIRKAKTLLNWEPKVELKESLLKMIKWFKEKGKGEFAREHKYIKKKNKRK